MDMPQVPIILRALLYNRLRDEPAKADGFYWRLSRQAAGRGFRHSPLRYAIWRALELNDRARRNALPRPVARALVLWWAEAGPVADTLRVAQDRFGRPRKR